MKLIPLNRGLFTMVDDEDFQTLGQMRWQPLRGKRRGQGYNYYAYRQPTGATPVLYMHRVILQPADDQQVDHIDGDGLNNQRSNLRICSGSENLCNRGLQSNNTSGHVGVSYQKGRQRWHAYIKKAGKTIHLGNYTVLEEAVAARQRAEVLYHGEFAFARRSKHDFPPC